MNIKHTQNAPTGVIRLMTLTMKKIKQLMPKNGHAEISVTEGNGEQAKTIVIRSETHMREGKCSETRGELVSSSK